MSPLAQSLHRRHSAVGSSVGLPHIYPECKCPVATPIRWIASALGHGRQDVIVKNLDGFAGIGCWPWHREDCHHEILLGNDEDVLAPPADGRVDASGKHPPEISIADDSTALGVERDVLLKGFLTQASGTTWASPHRPF